MISRVYVGVFHAPPPSKWGKKFKHGGLVANIRNMLKIPVGSTRIVRETMLATWNSLKNNGDGAIDLSRKPRFVGPSASFTTRTPVNSVIRRLNPIRNKFRKVNQQSANHGTWVKARHNWCLQLLIRLGLDSDKVVSDSLSALPSVPSWLNKDTLSSQGYMFDIHQVSHFDEVHVKQKYGFSTSCQLRFKRGENGKIIKNENDKYEQNGNSGYGPERFNVNFKFEDEARFMFGVSMVKEEINDRLVSRGVRCPLFNRPVGKELFESDNLRDIPRVGKKTFNLLQSAGLCTVKDCMNIDLENHLASIPVSEGRRDQIIKILRHAVTNANPGESFLCISILS